jgi:uncharacterized membrane protein
MRIARTGEQSAKRTQEALVSDLVAIAYPNLETAREVAQNVGQAQKAHLIELDDMVIAEHRNDGKLKLHQPSLAGVGAASGALAGKMTDSGVDDNFMKNLAAQLEPGKAALILLVRQANMDKILSEVKIPGEVIQSSLQSDTEEALREALEKAGSAA